MGAGLITSPVLNPGQGIICLANGRGGWTYISWLAWTPGANLP
jgi:hypothetical protein